MESEDRFEENQHPAKAVVEVKTSENRRKLIRGAVIGAPILLALKSTPVLACNCKQPSGFSTSGNLSQNAGSTCTQPARDCSYWLGHKEKVNGHYCFTGTGVQIDTPFKSIFGGTDSSTCIHVLGLGTLQSLVVSAYLGIKANYFVTGISANDIKAMWYQTYTPPHGTSRWNAAECENYLRYTMGLPLNTY